MRDRLTPERLRQLMESLSRSAPGNTRYRVYLVGGATAVQQGWRPSSIDADLYADRDSVFRDIQNIKERLKMNVELARPEDFVPPLAGTANRHQFIESIGRIDLYNYDPYAQLLSKIVRGFQRDLLDSENLISSGMVDVQTFLELVRSIPPAAYARYPALSARAVLQAAEKFVETLRR